MSYWAFFWMLLAPGAIGLGLLWWSASGVLDEIGGYRDELREWREDLEE